MQFIENNNSRITGKKIITLKYAKKHGFNIGSYVNDLPDNIIGIAIWDVELFNYYFMPLYFNSNKETRIFITKEN